MAHSEKYDSELGERLDAEMADDELGSVEELGQFRRFNKERVILHHDQMGNVWTMEYDGVQALVEAWESLEVEYEDFDTGVVGVV